MLYLNRNRWQKAKKYNLFYPAVMSNGMNWYPSNKKHMFWFFFSCFWFLIEKHGFIFFFFAHFNKKKRKMVMRKTNKYKNKINVLHHNFLYLIARKAFFLTFCAFIISFCCFLFIPFAFILSVNSKHVCIYSIQSYVRIDRLCTFTAVK